MSTVKKHTVVSVCKAHGTKIAVWKRTEKLYELSGHISNISHLMMFGDFLLSVCEVGHVKSMFSVRTQGGHQLPVVKEGTRGRGTRKEGERMGAVAMKTYIMVTFCRPTKCVSGICPRAAPKVRHRRGKLPPKSFS